MGEMKIVRVEVLCRWINPVWINGLKSAGVRALEFPPPPDHTRTLARDVPPVISQHAQHHRRSTYAVKHWQAHKRATYPGTYVSHHLREACRISSDAWWESQCCRPCLHCPTQ